MGTVEELEKVLDGRDPIEWAQAQVREMTEQEKEEKREVNIRFQPAEHLKKR